LRFAYQGNARRVSKRHGAFNLYPSETCAQIASQLEHRFTTTQASIDTDKELLREAQPLTGIKTKRPVGHAALELWVRHLKQDQALRRRTRGIQKNESKD
jgi:Arc/MetJ family transcription regulator